MNKILEGDCLEKLKELEDNSVDSIVTDPPYELGFMGKSWDSTGIANNVEMWKECLRVLKPGGYLLSFGGTRTYHRMASAIEDAGFDIRDQIVWCYGQGFPKSLNISLQIKKKYNIGLCTCNVFDPMIELGYENSNNKRDNISNGDDDGLGSGKQIQHKRDDNNEMAEQVKDTYLPPDNAFRKESGVFKLSEKDNKKEQGLKEVVKSILQSGVCESISEDKGLGNITLRSGVEKDKTTSEREGQNMSNMQNETTDGIAGSSLNTIQTGRQELYGEPGGSLPQLPQQDRENNRKRIEEIKNDCKTEEWNNLNRFVCSKCCCLKKDIGGTALKPSIEPICMARKPLSEKTVAQNVLKYGTGGINIDESKVPYSDTNRPIPQLEQNKREIKTDNGMYGGNSFNGSKTKSTIGGSLDGRFPSNLIHDNSEEVRECFPKESERFFKSIIYQAKPSKSERNKGCDGLEEKQYSHDGRQKEIENPYQRNKSVTTNNHPTVKPIALMEYLIKMVTPKGGIVLDPFCGSGTTLIAAKKNGFQYIGIEKESNYIEISEARLDF